MINFREKKFRVLARDSDVTVYLTVELSGQHLTSQEFKTLRSALKRRIVDAVQQLPYFTVQFEDISIKNLKVGA